MLKQFVEWDADLSERIRLQPGKKPWWPVAAFLAHSGDSWFWLAGLVIVWLVADGDWRRRAATLAFSLTFEAVVVLGIKFVVRRRRPEGDWGTIYRATDPHSFPSGHAARAGLLAVMAVGMGPAWFGLLLMIWAPLVSLARAVTGVHYVSDVLVGFVVGLVFGSIMLVVMPAVVPLVPFFF